MVFLTDPDPDGDIIRNYWGQASDAVVRGGDHIDMRPVLAAYQEPARHYHNAHHIAECLRQLPAVWPKLRRPHAVSIALIFHDVVYDPSHGDNEERSADWARRLLSSRSSAANFIGAVVDLILATKHVGEPADYDTAVVVDIDLSILGQSADEFGAYERAIRREYAHVPDAAFAAGRAKVLRHFLGRPSIYATRTFQAKYEQSARRNLERALARWEAGGAPS